MCRYLLVLSKAVSTLSGSFQAVISYSKLLKTHGVGHFARNVHTYYFDSEAPTHRDHVLQLLRPGWNLSSLSIRKTQNKNISQTNSTNNQRYTKYITPPCIRRILIPSEPNPNPTLGIVNKDFQPPACLSPSYSRSLRRRVQHVP